MGRQPWLALPLSMRGDAGALRRTRTLPPKRGASSAARLMPRARTHMHAHAHAPCRGPLRLPSAQYAAQRLTRAALLPTEATRGGSVERRACARGYGRRGGRAWARPWRHIQRACVGRAWRWAVHRREGGPPLPCAGPLTHQLWTQDAPCVLCGPLWGAGAKGKGGRGRAQAGHSQAAVHVRQAGERRGVRCARAACGRSARLRTAPGGRVGK